MATEAKGPDPVKYFQRILGYSGIPELLLVENGHAAVKIHSDGLT